MFEAITLRGTAGVILLGHQEAALLRDWTIAHHRPDDAHDGRWTLRATFARVNRFYLGRRPLLFTSARPGLPYSCWPLYTPSIQIGDTRLIATLGPPEQ